MDHLNTSSNLKFCFKQIFFKYCKAVSVHFSNNENFRTLTNESENRSFKMVSLAFASFSQMAGTFSGSSQSPASAYKNEK